MGVDLLDFFRNERPWAQLYRFLERLPPWGYYKSELVMNEEWARVVCDMEEKGSEVPDEFLPPPEDVMTPLEYTPVISRLDSMLDRIQQVETAVIWTVNPKLDRPKIQPARRPETALDKERERRTRSLLEEVDALFRGPGLPVM